MTRKGRGIHGRPEDAGEKNLPKGYAESHRDEDNTLAGIMPIYKRGFKNRQNYKGLWTEEDLERELQAYFDYCVENKVKPAKVGVALWLGISTSQLYEWASDKPQYKLKSELINQAFRAIELSYIGRAEKYPTANLFLLRTCHGHVETNKVDVTTNNQLNTEDINQAIEKLGLDKK